MQNRYEIVDIPVNDLKPAAYNPRRISEGELEKVKESIRDSEWLTTSWSTPI